MFQATNQWLFSHSPLMIHGVTLQVLYIPGRGIHGRSDGVLLLMTQVRQ